MAKLETPSATDSLRERCRQWLDRRQMNAIMRVGSEVDDLVAFVLTETGRSADPSLEKTLPLCLYFGTDADRDEFMVLMREAKPGMAMRKMP